MKFRWLSRHCVRSGTESLLCHLLQVPWRIRLYLLLAIHYNVAWAELTTSGGVTAPQSREGIGGLKATRTASAS